MVMENVSFNTADGEVVILEATAYPTAQEVLEVLEDENVPLSFWPDIALGYYRLKRYDEFVFLLEKVEKKETDQTKDQMRCLDLLAAYYVKKGRSFRNEKDRKEYFGKATVLYTTADKLMMYDVSHLIGRAYFCLLEAVKSGQAKAQFDYVINYRPSDTSAIIGRALENYASGEYEAALAFFRKALKMKPDLPAEVRLGFGHCFLKLKNYEKAKAAFNRVVILDPKNISARVALAVCYFHDGNTEIAVKALASCHNADSSNLVILNQLANVYFLTNQNEKAEEIAWSAYNSSVQNDLKAESCYLIARCHHRKREYDIAFRYYYQASQFAAPKFVLPFYGLAQIHLGRGEFDQAIDCFEKVLKEYPDDYETLKALGSIYTRWQGPIEDDKIRESQRKGEELLRKVIEMNPEDYEVILELAQLQESTRPAEALKKYEKVCAILEVDESFEVPSELYCNIGALHYQLGHYVQSKTYYEKAEELLQSKNVSLLGDDENEAKLITVQYNLGRLYEALSRFEIAEEYYNEILTQKPNHMDSFVRLGCIYRERGDTTKAIEYYNNAISADENCDVPYLYMANLNVLMNKIKEAQQTFEAVLKLRDHKDNAYALIGLGNVWLEALFNVKRGDQDEKEKMIKFCDHAMNCYLKVLKHHPHNAWAVNGIGCVLAHKGQTQDARELYSQVREAAPELNDVFLNLAHIHMDNRQYSVALQMYKSIMTRQKRQFDIQLLQYAARAAWKCNNWSECRDLLQRAIAEAPTNLLLRYSLAVVLQCIATHIMREEKATVEEFAGAVEDYKIAEKTFVYLSHQPDEIMTRYRYISRQVCKNEAGVCKDLLAQAKQFYKSACKKEAEEKEKQERIKALREEQIRIRQEEERQQLLKQQELEAELRKQRAFYLEKTKEMLKVSQVVEEKKEEKTKKKSGGRRKKNKDEDDFLNDSDEGGRGGGGDGEKKKKEKRRKRKRDVVVEGGGGSGSEGENKAPKKKRKAGKKPVVAEEPDRKGKVKSRAFVSSSSSSESDKENGGTSQPQRIVSGNEEVLPAISDDSDLSDSPKKNESDEEDENLSKAVKRARIEDSDADDDEEPPVLEAVGSPAESEDQIKPPESVSN